MSSRLHPFVVITPPIHFFFAFGFYCPVPIYIHRVNCYIPTPGTSYVLKAAAQSSGKTDIHVLAQNPALFPDISDMVSKPRIKFGFVSKLYPIKPFVRCWEQLPQSVTSALGLCSPMPISAVYRESQLLHAIYFLKAAA